MRENRGTREKRWIYDRIGVAIMITAITAVDTTNGVVYVGTKAHAVTPQTLMSLKNMKNTPLGIG